MSQGPALIQTYSINPGGSKSKLNVSAIGQISNAKGVLRRIVVVTAPSAGNLTLTDMQTGGTPAAGNQVDNIPFGSLTLTGLPISLELAFMNGIAVTGTWPTGAVLNFFYD